MRNLPTWPDLTHFVGSYICRIWLRTFHGVTVRGRGHIPPGPVLFAANHRSFADPPLVGMWSPTPCAYLARDSLWKFKPLGWLLSSLRSIPVDRKNPGVSVMKGAIERLREGVPVVIFPEGTRTKTGRLGVLKDGPALISRRAGVPLVPVYVHRAERCWPQGQPWPNPWGTRLQVRFGRPLVPPAGLSPKEQDAWKTRRLELWLRYQERWFDARFCRRRAGSPSSRHASR